MAILLSAVALIAIVVTLFPYDKQPLPEWRESLELSDWSDSRLT